ncbi:ATP synthase F1, delta subunit [gamma proteobacterium HTCC5015]|nr:ATP synthase F1, delta subunit [gamma proteobacterium HTCC5015]
MSEITTAARPYARAVFELAHKDESYEAWNGQLQFLAAVAAEPRVQSLLTSPSMRNEERADAFIKLCEGHIDDNGANLVRVMSDNRRLALLPAVAELFRELSDEAQGIVDAQVTGAFEVTSDQQEAIKKALGEKLGKKITLDCVTDESLVGGIVIRAGDIVIDGSVRTRVAQLAAQLVK